MVENFCRTSRQPRSNGELRSWKRGRRCCPPTTGTLRSTPSTTCSGGSHERHRRALREQGNGGGPPREQREHRSRRRLLDWVRPSRRNPRSHGRRPRTQRDPEGAPAMTDLERVAKAVKPWVKSQE